MIPNQYYNTTKMFNYLIAILLSLLSYLFISQYIKCKKAHQFWHSRSVQTPRPVLFFGNLLDVFLGDRRQLEKKWRQEFGKVYGLYYGNEAHLVITDPDLIQQVCIKDFDAFINTDLDFQHFNKTLGNSLICLKDDQWRRVRNIMSPTFTSGKIRRMFQCLNECADDLVGHLKSAMGADETMTFNGKDVASLYTMDAICTCCYALKLKRPVGAKNLKEAALRDDFIRDGLKAFDFNFIGFVAHAMLPIWLCDLLNLCPVPNSNTDPIANKVKALIAKRKILPPADRPNDYLQSLIDAQLSSEPRIHEEDSQTEYQESVILSSINSEQTKSTKQDPIRLTDQEMFSQAVLLMLAGLETTGTLLCNAFYTLAHRAQFQEELYQAIKVLYDGANDTFNYDSLIACPLLDSFVAEVTRMMPIFSELTRVASRDFHFDKLNLSIPKGTIVDMASAQIMSDPEYWDQPDEFKPERFMPQNRHKLVPFTYQTFGLGPRHCLGMRFALTEAKVALARLLMNFVFEAAPNTEFPPNFVLKGPIYKLTNPSVKIKRRL